MKTVHSYGFKFHVMNEQFKVFIVLMWYKEKSIM